MDNLGPTLPIDAVLPELAEKLRHSNAAVLVAPPGAGKTTRVPLALAAQGWAAGKRILVLEPRRLAARAAAGYMARLLGERVGDKVGLRVRFGSSVSRATVIEVITEGIFTRMILDDPALEGVAAVLFDEFHERSLDADLGLALARDAQQGLREDLKLLVMSATIDGARVAALFGGAPVIESQGRAFAVETRYAGRDAQPIEPQIADVILRATRAEPGSLLAFLPGTAEIRRTETLLKERIDAATDIAPLYGALEGDEQDRAIAPAPAGRRKIVLATAIAETSITIEGVRIVVDSGLARVPRYEPDIGITRLETVRVSRAAADQRRGRAGRTEPGVCYRLWDEPQTASLEPFARPEILAADLSGFALDLAAWGAAPDQLAFLDPPPRAALAEAHALLRELGAIGGDSRITEEGKKLRRLPLPPRLARMVIDAGTEGEALLAAEIAAVPPTSTERMAAMRRSAPRSTWSVSEPPLIDAGCKGRGAPDLVLVHRPALEREVARVCVVLRSRHRGQQWLVHVALPVDEARTTRMEAAGGRRVERARDVPHEHDLLARAPERRIGDRHRREQGAAVRMLRRRVQLLLGAGLHRLAEIHDHDAVRDVPDDVQVVRDEDVREVEIALEVLEQVQDLRLHRDVERRDRLVADDQLRVDGESAGDADPLPLPTRELVREPVVVLGVEADDVEQLLHALLDLGGRADPVHLEPLGDDEADALAAVE